MELALVWLQANWFTVVQTLGIVGSVLLTLMAVSRDTRSRQVSNYLTLASHHREIWSEASRRPELARISKSEVDLISEPISVAEEEFLLLVLTHFHTGWLVARDAQLIPQKVLAMDAKDFFSLPIPRAVWEKAKHVRDPRFVRFVEKALKQ